MMPMSACADGERRRRRLSKRRLTLSPPLSPMRECGNRIALCEAPDLELLFIEWLNTVIYEMAVRKMLFARFEVQIQGGRLEGTLWGEPVDIRRHAPACEPKGAAYAQLKVAKDADGLWSAGCVVDV
jgi:SHS2 domain-containing protein